MKRSILISDAAAHRDSGLGAASPIWHLHLWVVVVQLSSFILLLYHCYKIRLFEKVWSDAKPEELMGFLSGLFVGL